MTRISDMEAPALERQRGYARERRLDETQPQKVRPRLGGEVLLPAANVASELFLVLLEDLSAEERSAPGWCIRLGVPSDIPADQEYDVHELLVELTVTVGGVSHVLEVNAFPGCVVHLVGEQVSARVKWGIADAIVPATPVLRWQVTRGLCATSAVRAYTVQSAGVGAVPPFATGFALFSGEAAIAEDIQLNFSTHPSATRVIQHYTAPDLLQTVAAFTTVPPGAGEWRWLTATAAPVRLVFALGAQSGTGLVLP
jgi:hypothetical protein